MHALQRPRLFTGIVTAFLMIEIVVVQNLVRDIVETDVSAHDRLVGLRHDVLVVNEERALRVARLRRYMSDQ